MTTLTLNESDVSVLGPMKGAGYYDINCEPQHADILRSRELLLKLARRCPWPSGSQAFVLADFGCGQGRNSCDLFDPVIDQLLECESDVAINVVRNDLASNDFKTLAHRVARKRHPRVFEFLAPGSFHQPVLPKNSLHLGTCFSALHWLTSLPDKRVPGHITHEVNDDLCAAEYRSHWQRDWRAFLRSRSIELVGGGQMLISFVARQSAGDPVHAPFELLHTAAVSMVEDGHLSADQLEQFQLPIHRPLYDEVMDPFGQTGFDGFCGLRVTHVEVSRPVCPLFTDWKLDRNPRRFAYRYAEFIRAFTEPTVRAGMFGEESGSDTESSATQPLLDCLYERIRRLIVATPSKFELKRTRITLALRKSNCN